jgi:uncharacterized protein (TIGR02466 family)
LLKYLWFDSDRLNEELEQLILSKEKEHRGVSTTNVGGWHSKKDFQTWDGECVKILLSRMLILGQEMIKRVYDSTEPELLADWKIQAWANINRHGHYNKFHTHIRNLNLWSGVYYVNTGLKETDTVQPAGIIFADQHRVEPMNREEFRLRYSIEPQPGLMLLFPSSLGHRVAPHLGTGDRITIAFNLKNSRFSTINYEIEKNNVGKPLPIDGSGFSEKM